MSTSRDIRLEPMLGGEFSTYATVTLLRRPERLRMSGGMGMSGAVAGVIDIRLTLRRKSTILHLSHRAVGEVTEETRAGYDTGWKVLLAERLKAYVERGQRTGLRR
ncbi:MAG TPA: hypothetical protein VJ206_06880 [bacterium]|jgi:hypothetical protein|nr:hypothetical protein [bacterium]